MGEAPASNFSSGISWVNKNQLSCLFFSPGTVVFIAKKCMCTLQVHVHVHVA